MEYVCYDAKRNFKISTLKWIMSAMMLKGIVKISTLKWSMYVCYDAKRNC